jgi:L-asparagine transporter-like permease
MQQVAYNVATALVAIGALLAWWFVLMYRRVKWRKYREGRHLMGFTLMVAIILSLAAVVRVFGPYPGMQYVAVVLYAWLVYLLAARIWLQRRAQREAQDITSITGGRR